MWHRFKKNRGGCAYLIKIVNFTYYSGNFRGTDIYTNNDIAYCQTPNLLFFF